MNILLIGMPGAGKSTLGVLLAKAAGMEFVDTDILIQKNQGRLLQDIIDNKGIEAFLAIEEDTLSNARFENTVIATGGSAVYSDKAMKKLKEGSLTLYLHVSYEEIEARLHNITTRGIVIKQGSSLREVYEEREPLYRQYSDKTIFCTHKGIEQSLIEIMYIIKEVKE